MSACNIWHQPGRAHLITDGAYYRPSDGTLLKCSSKVFDLPRSGSAFAFRGPAGIWMDWLAEKFDTAGCFDELIAKSGAHLYEIDQALRRICGAANVPGCEITLIGTDTLRDRIPQTWTLMTYPSPGADFTWEGYAPYVPHQLFNAVIRPGLFGPVNELLGIDDPVTLEKLHQIHVEDAAIVIVEAQRALRLSDFDGGPPIHGVGGFVELTTATRDGITRKILKEWPDEIGRPIIVRG